MSPQADFIAKGVNTGEKNNTAIKKSNESVKPPKQEVQGDREQKTIPNCDHVSPGQ